MRKNSYDFMQGIVKGILRIKIGAGGTVSVESFYDLAPDLWVDFLNADPRSPQSIWPIYRDFARGMEDIKDWLASAGYGCTPEPGEINMLSKREFLERYSVELHGAAVWLHEKITEALDGDNAAEAIEDMVRKADDWLPTGSGPQNEKLRIPPRRFTITAANASAAQTGRKNSYNIDIKLPGVAYPNFWLSVILSGMLSSYKAGRTARRCAAPDCRRYFVPDPRIRLQLYLYDTTACQSRHYKQRMAKTQPE